MFLLQQTMQSPRGRSGLRNRRTGGSARTRPGLVIQKKIVTRDTTKNRLKGKPLPSTNRRPTLALRDRCHVLLDFCGIEPCAVSDSPHGIQIELQIVHAGERCGQGLARVKEVPQVGP